MGSNLILSGAHPAAGWLALSLARRGWDVSWAEPDSPAFSWWGISHHLFERLGESLPAWPLELCATELDGLGRYMDQRLAELRPWPGVLIDTAAFAGEIAREMAQLGVLCLPLNALDAEAARLGEREAVWCLEIGFGPCRGACSARERCGVLQGVNLPAGLLELYGEKRDSLCLTALAPGRAAFSYRVDPGVDQVTAPSVGAADAAFWARLNQALPGVTFRRDDLGWRNGCRCLPEFRQAGRHLRLSMPSPALDPTALICQSIGWIMAQVLVRWLGEELQDLDRLPADLESYLAKVLDLLPALTKSCAFLDLPR